MDDDVQYNSAFQRHISKIFTSFLSAIQIKFVTIAFIATKCLEFTSKENRFSSDKLFDGVVAIAANNHLVNSKISMPGNKFLKGFVHHLDKWTNFDSTVWSCGWPAIVILDMQILFYFHIYVARQCIANNFLSTVFTL